ncbi:GSU2403 family nucleotidyltransferase fold protein [Parasphingorhabdus cellanae]|uniref:Nucleotidyltransferase-like domain-containing protein n=1 Tax=Parasphingorhabdus cellanae TaxID=2806553 RepID=A0ABX7TAA6_9SPHN|nr:GSU2403 family nucleotidyltransferase fold protein [Parasphingorhabdus cellanae]QTD57312.1 hypothetical protein J4G78_07215 [Parasphingorhabdus cellanae]
MKNRETQDNKTVPIVVPFTDEQSRMLINLEQRYQVWMAAEQTLQAMPYNLARKQVKGHSYLYEIRNRKGDAKSLGPWSEEHEAKFEEYHDTKRTAKDRRDKSRDMLAETCRLYRALKLPLLSSGAGKILREADRRQLLGSHLIVVGTNAIPVYSIEASGFIQDVPDETEDFDLAWASTVPEEDTQSVWHMLKAVDSTYTVNTEKTFQARNATAYEVELLAAPSRIDTIYRTDKPKPVALPEQEWLLNGDFVNHVVVCRDGSPARIVAPDPRWFALQKLWMSDQKKRNALKRPKDLKQAMALLDATYLAMPQYPLNDRFGESLPDELKESFQKWSKNRPELDKPDW